ncbi:MAG: arylsulfatase A-like enzyme, partial [Rhodothermales bacterium]
MRPLLAITLILLLAASTSAAEKTNFLLCMTDDQGWGDIGYSGHSQLKTPELDKMAAESLRLDRFYVGAPICSPSRG